VAVNDSDVKVNEYAGKKPTVEELAVKDLADFSRILRLQNKLSVSTVFAHPVTIEFGNVTHDIDGAINYGG
jgi:hypothetical protein